MGVVEYGAPQILTFDFNSDATSKLFNQINKDINPIGIYEGFTLTRLSSSSVSIAEGVCYIEDSINNVGTRVQTSQAQVITVTNSTPFLVLRFVWENTSANYMDMLAVGFGDIQADDLILGRCVYNDTGTDFSATFDLTRRSIQALRSSIVKNSYFNVYPTEPPSRKVYIEGGILNSPQGNILFAGGVYPSVDIIDSINGQIDLIYVDFDGTLKVEYGIDSSTPVAPRYGNKKVIAEIRRGAARSNIKGNEIFKVITNFDMTPESSDLTIVDTGDLYASDNIENALQEIAGSTFTFKGNKTFDNTVTMKDSQIVEGSATENIQTLKTNAGIEVQYNDINGKLYNTVGSDIKITDPGSVFAVDKIDEAINQLGNGIITLKGVKTFDNSPLVPDLSSSDNTAKAVNSKFVQSEKLPLEALKTYSATYTYALNEATFYNGVPYKSLSAGNINNTPESSPTFWEITGGGSSTGSGGEVGYTLPNGQFESNVVGWEVYADAAASTPADGTGGIAASTFTRTDTNPLLGEWSAVFGKSANNRQGEGISTTITIDAGKTNAPAQVKFVYKTSANYVSGDIGLFIYDITNAILVPCNNININSSYGIPSVHIANFFPNLNSTSYRLIFHITSGNINDYSFTVDDITLGSKETIVASAISDWQAYIPTFQGFGAPTDVAFKWRRNGSNVDIKYKFTCGTTTAVEAQIGTPYSSRADVPTIEPIGTVERNTSDNNQLCAIMEASKSYFCIGSDVTGVLTKQNASTVFSSGQIVSGQVSFPCAQFSINGSFNGINEPLYLANSESVVNTAGVVAKTISSIDGTPILANTASTYYDLNLPRAVQPNESLSIQVMSVIDRTWMDISLARSVTRNLSTISFSGTSNLYGFSLMKTTSGVLRVFIGAYAGLSDGAASAAWSSVIPYFSRWRVHIGQAGLSESKPAQDEGYTIASVAYSTTVPIKATTKDYGAFSNYSPSSGIYTVPFNGLLKVTFGCTVDSNQTPSVYKNGSSFRQLASIVTSTAGLSSLTVPVSANDSIEVRGSQSSTVTFVTLQFELK